MYAGQRLGFLPGTTVALASGAGPVGVAIAISVTVIGTLYSTFRDWFQRGELKIAATAKAEDYVRSVWGTTEPNSPPDQDSVSKLIEECRLDEALQMIQFLARQMTEKAQTDEYFAKWVREWGAVTLQQIESKLFAYRGYCATVPEPTPSDPNPDYPIQYSCPNGFQLINNRCEMISPPVLPPAIDDSGQYVPLPKSSGLSVGMLGMLALLLGVVIISRR